MEIHIIQGNRDAYSVQGSKGQCLPNKFNEPSYLANENLDVNAVLNLQTEKSKLELLTDEALFINLKLLDISYCGLTEIPDVLFGLKYLTELNLSNNSLENLPEKLGNLCNLTILKLSTNKLSSLPKSLKNAVQLIYLDLSCNKFKKVPDVLFYSLWVLQVLDLSCNELVDFNDPPVCFYKLVVLGLSNNFLNHLPFWIFDNLCQLKYLDISKNPLNLGNQILNYCKTGIFETLQFLNFGNCNLSNETIQILTFFKNLKVLHLGNKIFENGKLRLNNFFGNLKLCIFKEIEQLHLQNAHISMLPTDLNYLKSVKVLDLSDNLLSWLPECFCDLGNIEILNLTSNQLLFLPTHIGNLVNLKQIHLGNNKLCCLPDGFYNLCNLEYVDLYNNHIEKVSPSILTGKHLKGIDLELNLLDFSFCEYNVDINKTKMLYECFKNSFRKVFNCADSRCDLQMKNLDKSLDEISESNSFSTGLSVSSFESDPLSDLEDIFSSNVPQTNYDEEDWEKKNTSQDIDEFFDPNGESKVQPPSISWKTEFQNNFCPAIDHVPSVMKTYVRNFNLASKNESVEEGQFDSD